MTFQVELRKCRWTTQGIDPTHIFPDPSMEVNEGPLLVSLMNDQNYFVHDGRHRCIRGLLRGDETHDAEWLEDHVAELEVARLREALKAHPFMKSVQDAIDEEEEAESVRRALQGGYISPVVLHSTTHSAYDIHHSGPKPSRLGSWEPDAVVTHAGAIVVNPESPVREALLEALNRAIYKAACGRDHQHEPHAFGEHMEEFCSGQPRLRKAFCGKTYEHNPHDATFDDPNAPAFRCDGIPK